MAYREDLENGDPHEEIVRLEEHIEELAAKIESCRKFILAARIAVAGGVAYFGRDAGRGNPVRSRAHGSGGLVIARRHCCMGFKQQYRKRGDEGASRIRVGARSSDRTHQSACHFIAKRRTDLAEASPEPPTSRECADTPLGAYADRPVTVSLGFSSMPGLFAIQFLWNNSQHNWLK